MTFCFIAVGEEYGAELLARGVCANEPLDIGSCGVGGQETDEREVGEEARPLELGELVGNDVHV